jgi:hypothetical protein
MAPNAVNDFHSGSHVFSQIPHLIKPRLHGGFWRTAVKVGEKTRKTRQFQRFRMAQNRSRHGPLELKAAANPSSPRRHNGHDENQFKDFLRRVRRAVVVPFVHDPWSKGCRKSPHAIPQNEPPGLPLSSIRPYGRADIGALTDRGSATQRVDKIVHGVAWHPKTKL